MKYISADYIKAVMKGDRLMQGNCEYELWKQEVDKKVDAMPSIDVMDVVTAYQQGWCDALDASISALNDAKFQLGKEADRKTENSSEKPNNCEHITEDGVTCAKYPACDGCLDNPLNKVKGSERLLKGSEQTEPTISKMEQVEPQTCSFSDCDNFKNPDYERCIECKRKQIKLKTEQTERSE